MIQYRLYSRNPSLHDKYDISGYSGGTVIIVIYFLLVLSEDSTTAYIQPYEEVQTSATDLLDQQDGLGKSLKCHQSRELPRIPPNNAIETILSTRNMETDNGLGMEGPYEVLKDSSSQENIVEDCLYETVKEIKDQGATTNTDKSTGSKAKTAMMVNGHLDHVMERKMESAEYASVDRNKKSRQSANSESPLSNTSDREDEVPPPVPVKLLDENENVQERGAKEEEEVMEGPSEPDKVNFMLVSCLDKIHYIRFGTGIYTYPIG